MKRLKTWKLKNKETRLEYGNYFVKKTSENDYNWEKVQREILAASKDVCRERAGMERETWWRSEQVRSLIEKKKTAFKVWQTTRNNSDKERYQARKREAKRCVAQARRRAWQEWTEYLDTIEGRNKMFRAAAQMRKDKVLHPRHEFY